MTGTLSNRPPPIVWCIPVIVLSAIFAACVRPTMTMIRIHNASRYDYQDLQVGDQHYGTLSADEVTEYRDFDTAYHYNYARLLIDGDEFIIQPIDYVGERPLGGGHFTYRIEVTNYQTRLLTITTSADSNTTNRDSRAGGDRGAP